MIRAYEFTEPGGNTVLIANSQSESVWNCPLHGYGCMGHLETNTDRNVVLLPSTMIPNIDDVTNRYQRYKNDLCSSRLSPDRYRSLTAKTMMGKKGMVRSINSVKVDGSIKMVISPSPDSNSNDVLVPSILCDRMLIPVVRGMEVVYEKVQEQCFGILTRQPVLWVGGIRPVRIIPTEPQIVSSEGYEWDVNYSLRIPAQICGSFGADFDGDEMALFPMITEASVLECKSVDWRERSGEREINNQLIHSLLIPSCDSQRRGRYDYGFAGTCLRSTLCISDLLRRGFRITDAHKACKISLGSYLNLATRPKSFKDFMAQSKISTDISASKSSLQSQVGAISRRSKLGSERVCISPTGCIQYMGSRCPSFSSYSVPREVIQQWSFGNPAVRGISKLTARVMQITLKVKSTNSVDNLSPTLTMLQGSTSWPTIMTDGTTQIHTVTTDVSHDVEASPSLWEISRLPSLKRFSVCKGCVIMCVAETRSMLDPVEFEHLVSLVHYLTQRELEANQGLAASTFDKTLDVPDLWRWSACYFDGHKRGVSMGVCLPQSLIERRFLANFSSLQGVCEESLGTVSITKYCSS